MNCATAPCRAPSRCPGGFSLVELVVAMVLLSVALVALAGTATVAARSFHDAATSEHAVRAAAQVIDSLVRVAAPVSGSGAVGDVELAWSVASDDGTLTFEVSSHHRGSRDTLVFRAARPAAPGDEP